jgi:hypothetical protein
VETVLPPYKRFVELERRTLKLLCDYLSQWPILSHTAGPAQRYCYQQHPTRFEFSIHWDVDYADQECRLFLGAEVNKQGRGNLVGNASYCICTVQGRQKPEKVLRKFHFDYITARLDQRAQHPRFHLQYCGGLPPALGAIGVTDDLMKELIPAVEGPRIFFGPMTLGLLMNMAFYEFPSDETDAIMERGEWRNLVQENITEILVPYYKRCAELGQKDKVYFFDEVYV